MLKFNSYLICKGKKRLSEKILLEMSKKFQKLSNKNFKKLLLLRLICSVIVFKVNNLLNKKQSFMLIKNKKTRISLAIKSVLTKTQTQRSNNFYKKLYLEVVSVLQDEIFIRSSVKKNSQEQVFLKKHLLLYYR